MVLVSTQEAESEGIVIVLYPWNQPASVDGRTEGVVVNPQLQLVEITLLRRFACKFAFSLESLITFSLL